MECRPGTATAADREAFRRSLIAMAPKSMPKMCLGLVLISYSYTAKPRSAKINKAKKTTNFRNYEVFRAFKRLMNCVTLQFSGILSIYRHSSSSSSLLWSWPLFAPFGRWIAVRGIRAFSSGAPASEPKYWHGPRSSHYLICWHSKLARWRFSGQSGQDRSDLSLEPVRPV